MEYCLILFNWSILDFQVVLFQCEWFDNTPNIGTKVDKNYGIVQVKESRRYNKAYDPFIFAQQVMDFL